MQKYKILLFGFPASGHLNPLFPIIKELIQSENFEIIIYIDEDNRKLVESIGATFRSIKGDFEPVKRILDNKSTKRKNSSIQTLVAAFYELTYINIDYLPNEIEKEKADLIIYDFLALYAKLILKYYKKRYELGQTMSPEKSPKEFFPKRPLPPIIVFSPSFAMDPNVYPNNYELDIWGRRGLLYFMKNYIHIFFMQLKFCFRYGLRLDSVIENTQLKQPDFINMVLTNIIPEIQPRSHLFNEKVFKFVGSTIDENYIDQRLNEHVFRNNLSLYPLRYMNFNENNEIVDKNEPLLVFVSLGTLFNNSFFIYKSIIDAFSEFDNEPPYFRHSFLKLKNLRILVSLGDQVLNEFKKLEQSGKYKIPENFILVQSAPQLEVLRRASLFVTHSGMNSASESIHFGVPMICIPLGADQPLVAYRVADELGLGIRLDKNNLKSTDVRKAAHIILSNESYYAKLKRYSQISRSYDGIKNSKDLILNLLNKKKF